MNTTKLTFKKVMPYIYGLIIFTCIIIALKTCNTKPPKGSINTNPLTELIADKEQIVDYLKDDNKLLKAQIDSLKALKPKVVIRYKTVYDSLLIVDTMCVKSLNTLYYECQKVDSVNNVIITKQENHIMNDSHIIGNLTDIISIQKYQHTQDSLEIKGLNKEVKKEKRKKVLMSVISGLAGIGLGGLIK